MPHQEDTLRSIKYYARNERKQIAEQGADELIPEPEARQATSEGERRQRNRAQLGVNEEHKTAEMRTRRRGTFP